MQGVAGSLRTGEIQKDVPEGGLGQLEAIHTRPLHELAKQGLRIQAIGKAKLLVLTQVYQRRLGEQASVLRTLGSLTVLCAGRRRRCSSTPQARRWCWRGWPSPRCSRASC